MTSTVVLMKNFDFGVNDVLIQIRKSLGVSWKDIAPQEESSSSSQLFVPAN